MQSLGNVFILGDSYSTFEGHIPEGYHTWYPVGGKPETDVTAVNQTWWHRLICHTGAYLIRNCSYSGTPICNTGYGGGYCPDISFVGRLNRLIDVGFFEENRIDTFFILGGTNDSWADSPVGEVKYGDYTDDDLRQVLPAFCYMISRIKECVPEARIVNIMNTDDLKPQIADGFRCACSYFGVENAEITEIDKMNGHPTVRGMEQIEETVMCCPGN